MFINTFKGYKDQFLLFFLYVVIFQIDLHLGPVMFLNKWFG
jgi:hypothetical protein